MTSRRTGWLEQRGEARRAEIGHRTVEIERRAARLAADCAALERERMTRLQERGTLDAAPGSGPVRRPRFGIGAQQHARYSFEQTDEGLPLMRAAKPSGGTLSMARASPARRSQTAPSE